MDFYQGVVTEFLRADRALFVNTECCIQINEGANPDTSGPHWYCDAVVADFKDKRVYLCEISYAAPPKDLVSRLASWNTHWTKLCAALRRDCQLLPDWPISPWLFVPSHVRSKLEAAVEKIGSRAGEAREMPAPRVTILEDVQPWMYRYWSRDHIGLDVAKLGVSVPITAST